MHGRWMDEGSFPSGVSARNILLLRNGAESTKAREVREPGPWVPWKPRESFLESINIH